MRYTPSSRPPKSMIEARNVLLNDFHRVSRNQAALSDGDGTQCSSFPPIVWRRVAARKLHATRGFLMTPAVRFDSYCRANVTQPIDFFKMDVEGGNSRVLRGLAN